MNVLIFVMVLLSTFIVMEGVTWLTHRYVMHGFLWYLHKDHHQPTKGFFEKNDLFFVIFAVPSMLLFYFGKVNGNWILLGLGGGIFLYGIAYFLVHEVIIHRRFKWFEKLNSRYVKVIRFAHKKHHKHLNKYPGESFGMLWVAKKYWDNVKSRS